MKEKIVVFGGSFNPVTNAHLALCEQLFNDLDIKEVIFLPVGNSYQKKELISSEHRLNMLREVCLNNTRLKISEIEIKSNILMKTIHSMHILKKQYPDNELLFLMGTDNLRDMPNWYRVEDLLSDFNFIVMQREGDNIEKIIDENEILRKNKHKFIPIKETVRNDISSTIIRNLLKENKSPRYLIPEEVYRYIKENNLYIEKEEN